MSDKESACNSGDTGDTSSIPGSGRSPGEGNGNPFQYSCLGNPMDRGIWRAAVHGVTRIRHDFVTKQQQIKYFYSLKISLPLPPPFALSLCIYTHT